MKLPRAADAGKRGLGLPSPNELVPARGRGQPPETATVGVSLGHRSTTHASHQCAWRMEWLCPVVDCPLYDDVLVGQTRCRASPPVKEIGMPIDPAALVQNVSSLGVLDPERDLARAMQQITSAAKT